MKQPFGAEPFAGRPYGRGNLDAMRVTLPPQSRVVKKVLPRTLLGRSLLIISIPLVLVLAVALQIFTAAT